MQKTLTIGGATIAYQVAGTGPAVLLVQGVGVAGSGWRPQVDALSARYRTVTFDNRGLGRSSAARDVLTIERMLQAKRALEGTQYRDVDFVFVCSPRQAKTIEYLNAMMKRLRSRQIGAGSSASCGASAKARNIDCEQSG